MPVGERIETTADDLSVPSQFLLDVYMLSIWWYYVPGVTCPYTWTPCPRGHCSAQDSLSGHSVTWLKEASSVDFCWRFLEPNLILSPPPLSVLYLAFILYLIYSFITKSMTIVDPSLEDSKVWHGNNLVLLSSELSFIWQPFTQLPRGLVILNFYQSKTTLAENDPSWCGCNQVQIGNIKWLTKGYKGDRLGAESY